MAKDQLFPVVQDVYTFSSPGQSKEDIAVWISERYAQGYKLLSASPYSKVTINGVDYPVVLYVFVLA
jgi:hypothetical protein